MMCSSRKAIVTAEIFAVLKVNGNAVVVVVVIGDAMLCGTHKSG